MAIIDLILPVLPTLLLASALWFSRNVIANFLTSSIEHRFNAKLEELRADLRQKEAEIAALRSGAMSALASRQIELDKRRLAAIDELWSSVTELGKAKAASMLMGTIRFEKAIEEAERNPHFRAIFEALGGNVDPNRLDLSGASKARPFVSPMAWAYYLALLAIATQAMMKVYMLKTGLNMPNVIDRDAVEDLVKVALPHREGYIDQYGESGYHQLLEELEQNLLSELRQMLEGTEADRANVEKAAEIARLATELQRQTTQGGMETTEGAAKT